MRDICLAIFFLVFITSFALSASYFEQVSIDSPVAWWRFDDYRYKDGLAAEEVTGNITDSTFQDDAMTVEAGIDGKCGWFNGNLAGIDFGNSLGEVIDGNSSVSVEMWIKNSWLLETYPSQRLFATRINSAQAGIDISIGSDSSGGYVSAGLRSIKDDPYMKVKGAFNYNNQWSHLAVVIEYSVNTVKIYLNGSLEHQEQLDFSMNEYVYGTPTQPDQIGRSPTLDAAYRGYIDEVAVYDKALSPSRIQAHYTAAVPQTAAPLWESIISNEGSADGPYLGSPSIHKFNDGTIVATHDYFGSNKPVPTGTSSTKISYDNGNTWWQRANITGVVMASLFEHDGELYAFGISRNPGHITIAKSSNYGSSWTSPYDAENGRLFEAVSEGQIGYHTAPVPVLFADGRIFRVFEIRDKSQPWPDFEAVVVSADENADLLDADSWTMTNPIEFDPQWAQDWGSTRPGWLEGNAVEGPEGDIYAIMRVNSDPAVGKAAVLTLSEDFNTLNFDPQTGFIDMPGGRNKFHIQLDPVTGKYLTLNNNNTDPSRPAQRNTLSLIASNDLIHWEHIRTVLQDNSSMRWYESMVNTGFQYVVWEFDGDDIIYISRTAYDGANNYHDANKVTFHRLENYLDFVAPCGSWGYAPGDFNQDCVVDLHDFYQFSNEWLICTQPYKDGCINALEVFNENK